MLRPNTHEDSGSARTPENVSPREIRRLILEQSKRAHVGHIGSALSVVEIVAALFSGAIRDAGSDRPDRDRFILSKGHAALAVYAALYARGILTRDALGSFCAEDSLLGVHPEHALTGIDFSTGSLGQGLSVGAGAALAARMQRSDRRVFVLVSDAECNEGSLWEAVMFAAHHHLDNLIAICDLNGQQALGKTEDVLSMSPMEERWRAFGWDTRLVDGHDVSAISHGLETHAAETTGNSENKQHAPRVLIANTVFGKGVSYMERQIKWHYWPMSDEEYEIAVREIENDTH